MLYKKVIKIYKISNNNYICLDDQEILIEQIPTIIKVENKDLTFKNINKSEKNNLPEEIPKQFSKEELSTEDPYKLILMNAENNKILEDLTEDALNGDKSSEEYQVEF